MVTSDMSPAVQEQIDSEIKRLLQVIKGPFHNIICDVMVSMIILNVVNRADLPTLTILA
jgi:hypothetical protein